MKTSEEKDDLKNISLNNDLNEEIEFSTENKAKNSDGISENYNFGWNSYSEITNGRFAMLGLLAIILIELLSQESFLKWAGIL